MFGLGHMEIAIIAIVAVLLFGSRLPKLAYALGNSVVSFRKGVSGAEAELCAGVEEFDSTLRDAERQIRS